MKLQSALAIYLLFWMITLFAVLPFGVRTPHDDGEAGVPGQAPSAPKNPMILRKLAWTTAISAALFGLWFINLKAGWVTMDDVPGWQTVGPYAPGARQH
jgi:predicted secreted protein